ncbi:MAG TPA: hypothetical protein VH394_01290 [Thermoanaerobaculia bacterium]|jgi:hypothetical protein|nr:hypothetical protein [Thermoanaerobaculia bacterium]
MKLDQLGPKVEDTLNRIARANYAILRKYPIEQRIVICSDYRPGMKSAEWILRNVNRFRLKEITDLIGEATTIDLSQKFGSYLQASVTDQVSEYIALGTCLNACRQVRQQLTPYWKIGKQLSETRPYPKS